MKDTSIKKFTTEAEAKEYGKNFGKHQFERVEVAGKSVILCGTDQAFEEELWGDAYRMLLDFCDKFGAKNGSEDDYSDFATDLASEIRDLILKRYEEENQTKFISVSTEY